MTMDQELRKTRPPAAGSARDRVRRRARSPLAQLVIVILCALLGIVLVAQVRADEPGAAQLEAEREEDLARILSNLSAESDRLQSELRELQLTLAAFENSAEREDLAVQSLERRLEALSILAGVVAAEGEGLVLTIRDPERRVDSERFVDAVTELRDAGAEAIGINEVRLVASSAFSRRNDRLVVDGETLDPPYRITAVGPGETMRSALRLPGGVIDALERDALVDVEVELGSQLSVPARGEPTSFVHGEPVPPDNG